MMTVNSFSLVRKGTTVSGLPVPAAPELVRPLFLCLVLFEKPAQLVMDLSLVGSAREEDADAVGIVLEVCCFIVQDEKNLFVFPEPVLLVFAFHVPLPLLPCGRGIFTVVPEDAHGFLYTMRTTGAFKDTGRGAILFLRHDRMEIHGKPEASCDTGGGRGPEFFLTIVADTYRLS